MSRRATALTLVLVLVATALAAAPGAANHGTTETREYDGGLGPTLYLAFCGEQEPLDGINGVTFCGVDDPAPSQATIVIDDTTGLDVPAQAVFWDASGDLIRSESLCGTETVDVPADTAELLVDMDPVFPNGDVVFGNEDPCPAIGTRGTVTVTWSAF